MILRIPRLTLLVTVALPFSLAAQNTAVVAEHLYTMDAGPQGGPGMVLIRDGKIDDIRQGANLQPPTGFQVVHGAYVTPGLCAILAKVAAWWFLGKVAARSNRAGIA